MELSVTINSDEKGYFDRECPNEECLYHFKIHMDDWENKVSDDEVYCPMCGHCDTSDKWWTQEQLDSMQNIAADWAMSLINEKLDDAFKGLERSTRHNKYVKFKYNPGHRTTFINNPIGQSEEWDREVECKHCGTRYSVIGTAYFCPCCGKNTILENFQISIDNIKNILKSLPEMNSLLQQSYGKDTATSMCQSMLENSLGDIVSAFQKFCEVKFTSICTEKVRVNDFQMLEKGSQLFEKASGSNYHDWINDSEYEFASIMFQKRHLFEHNGGIVDEAYFNKTNDNSYTIGQRIIVKENDILDFIEIISKLSNEISKL